MSVKFIVPTELAEESVAAGLAAPSTIRRQRGVELVPEWIEVVATGLATVITLIQAPDAIRAFADKLRRGARIDQRGRLRVWVSHNERTVAIDIDGTHSVDKVANLLEHALGGTSEPSDHEPSR